MNGIVSQISFSVPLSLVCENALYLCELILRLVTLLKVLINSKSSICFWWHL